MALAQPAGLAAMVLNLKVGGGQYVWVAFCVWSSAVKDDIKAQLLLAQETPSSKRKQRVNVQHT